MKQVVIINKVNGEINRVGLYNVNTDGNMKWVKWLRKKDYKTYALINDVEIFEQEI